MGPLSGVKVVELAGIGPAPFCCMLLADMGADVIRVDRTAATDLGSPGDPRFALLNRGKRSIAVDLKQKDGVDLVKQLIRDADILVEGMRPGVTERMGLGPEHCWEINPRLVYGRVTGWGQEGPISQAAGHDINYIALTGALDAIGPADGPPVPPINWLGDFAGGSLYLGFGVVCALLEAKQSGRGQVVDAAIIDGVSHLMTDMFGKVFQGRWGARGTNLLDGGAPLYGVYKTKDERYISIGPIEMKFFAELMQRLGLDYDGGDHREPSKWPAMKEKLTAVFVTRTRDEWTALLEGTDVCFAPVLTAQEAKSHPQMRDRDLFVTVDGVEQPAPAPRFSRSKPSVKGGPALPGAHSDDILAEIGMTKQDVEKLRGAKVIK